MVKRLSEQMVHLGLGATAVPQPPFTGFDWYEGYGARHAADGREGRLLSMHTFEAPWSSWEMHPEGTEVVLCTEGEITLAGTIPVTSTAEVQRTKVAGRKYLDDIVRQPFAYEDGHLVVPDGPGLGIEVDEAKLQKYSVAL